MDTTRGSVRRCSRRRRGLTLAPLSPAAAAAPNTAVGLQATGLIPISPLAASTFPGTSPNQLAAVAPDGTLTVDALSISLLGGLQNVIVGTAVCNEAALT
ncbi:hypothetical protein MXD63_17030 [Frankia sp. Cpl3]|nr:hypothetical protein [Frankia sp. Cpl3]